MPLPSPPTEINPDCVFLLTIKQEIYACILFVLICAELELQRHYTIEITPYIALHGHKNYDLFLNGIWV